MSRDAKSISTVAGSVNAFIATHGLSGCPDIYRIAYQYIAKEAVTVGRVDALIIANQLSDDTLLSLVAKEDNSELDSLPDIVDALMNSVSEVGKALGMSDEVFLNAKELLSTGNVSAEKLGAITAMLIGASESAMKAADEVGAQLTASLSEVTQLKTSLDDNRKQMETDHLTQVGNRIYMERVFSSISEDQASIVDGTSIVVVDIDNFKRLNDTHGHQIGDKVLRYISNHLAKNSEEEQFHVTRFGGEEFVLIFPDRDLPSVYELVDTIRDELSSRVITRKDTQQSLGKLTASFGIAHISKEDLDAGVEDAFNLTQLIERADHAMYQAKNTGKNKVIVAPSLADVTISFN